MYSCHVCGRYALHANPDVVALQFSLDARPAFKASYNVCPGTDVLAVRNDRAGHRTAAPLRWGAGGKLVNARAETLLERPSFRNAFRQFRCLVPASGFYEWQKAASARRPWYVLPRETSLFGLGGIVLLRQGMRAVAIVTTAANELMAPIHDRMPVIVAPEDYAAWLDGANADAERLLRPCPAALMQAYPVSSRVNAPANDDPLLLEPV
jgi:putative SOS response-associated peptidase YedK